MHAFLISESCNTKINQFFNRLIKSFILLNSTFMSIEKNTTTIK